MKLIDTFPFKYQIIEDASGEGKTQKVRGVFQRADERNANGRIYPRKLWEKILESKTFRESIDRRRMIGNIDHPGNSELRLSDSAILISGLSLQENNEVVGEFELLPTAQGQHLKALMSAGVEFGISSRGEGSVYEKNGETFIGEDYNLITFDVVANPSTRGAYPTLVKESISSSIEEKNPVSSKEKLAILKEQAQSISKVNLSETTADQRNRLAANAESILAGLGALVNEDSTLKYAADSVANTLSESIKNFYSKESPPVMEQQLEASYQVIDEMANQIATRERKILGTAKKRISETSRKLSSKIVRLEAQLRTVVAENRKLRKKVAVQEEVGDNLLREFNKLKESKGSVVNTTRRNINSRRESVIERIRARRAAKQNETKDTGVGFRRRRAALNETNSRDILDRFNGGGKRVERKEVVRNSGAINEQQALANTFIGTIGGKL